MHQFLRCLKCSDAISLVILTLKGVQRLHDLALQFADGIDVDNGRHFIYCEKVYTYTRA